MTRRKIFRKRIGNKKQYESYISRTTQTVSLGDDPKDIMDLIDNIQDDQDSDPITPFEEFATDILQKAGLEPTFLGDTAVAVKEKVHEPEWYAVKLLEYAWRARKAIEGGNTKLALKCGMDLSTAYHHMFIHDIENAARSGEEQIYSGMKARKYSEVDKTNWLTLASKLQESKPRLSTLQIAKRISNDTGDGFETIKKHLYENK